MEAFKCIVLRKCCSYKSLFGFYVFCFVFAALRKKERRKKMLWNKKRKRNVKKTELRIGCDFIIKIIIYLLSI